MNSELLVVTVLKALSELAGLFLFGQGLLFMLAGPKRDSNGFYQLFRVLTSPVVKVTRAVTPRAVVDRHVPFVAFLLILWVWLALLYWKAKICSTGDVECVPPSDAGRASVSAPWSARALSPTAGAASYRVA